MADHQWRDPLLLTDVSWQQHGSSFNCSADSMADPNSPSDMNEDSVDASWKYQSLEDISARKSNDPVAKDAVDGRSMLGFSLTSPDLVICTGSPDVPRGGFEDSPNLLGDKCHHNLGSSFELSLENGINGSEIKETSKKTPSVRFSTVCQTFEMELSPEASFELFRKPDYEEDFPKDSLPIVTINAGSTDGTVILGEVSFLEDKCFTGGDTARASSDVIGDGNDLLLYQTARFGNFSYNFQSLDAGNYIVDLHFAEIVFTNGPPGMRVFDVYIQEEKVVSGLDVYARVGANKPLIISDIKTSVDGNGNGLSIRFEGVTGSPILCGISIRKGSPESSGEVMGSSEMAECNEIEGDNDCEGEGDDQKLRRDYECQRKELIEMRSAIEELKRENQLKTRECHEAWKSSEDLRSELMRKSMHVGSLAFAIEGQVKEKGRWFSSLRDLTRKLMIMKMEHINLSEEALAYKNFLADMKETTSTIQSTMNHHVNLHEDLKIKFLEGVKERKQLYNKVLELKGNIRVFCRCRPLNTEEIAAGDSMAIDFDSAKDGELIVKSNGVPKKTFKFDAVFGPQADQADVFEDTAPFATSVLDGYNVCIFAYGQTGTGKTFTMEGTDGARGVNFRTLNELFHIIREREKQYRYDISVSVLEVYNEQIRDLLVSNSQPGVAAKRLEIKQVSEGTHHVPGLVEAHVNNMSEVWEVLKTGSNARAVGSTNANEHSSRSHCIHCVMVKGENLLNGECTRSKLWLVDLAGSERVAKTEVQGERLKETQNINRSLSALGDVISALATKSPHIPFRNSKLTHLLQDSLGGDSKTLMFVQISPNESDLSETLCSLNFASRVRGIELGPARKQLDTSELFKYKQMVEKTKQEMKGKDVQIRKLEETIQSMDLKMREKDLKYKNLQDKLKELESQLLIERKLARQHVDTKIAEQHQQQQQMKQSEEQNSAPARPPLANRLLSTQKNSNEKIAEQYQQQQQMKQSEEQNSAPTRPPLANRLLSTQKNSNEPGVVALYKDHLNPTRPLTENNYKFPSLLPPSDGFVKQIDLTEKENNPEIAERSLLPKRTGRASICTTARRTQIVPPTSRRNSLAPFPSSVHIGTPFLPLPSYQDDEREDVDGSEANCLPELAASPKTAKSGSKKLSSILRRSLHKKFQTKSPMQQHMRRGGVNVGMEKVRVSIGSRGRILGNGRRMGAKEIQQKQQSQKEKERGWNIGSAAGRFV